MSECTNPHIGKLIAHFELNTLDEEERDIFEQHLMDCSFCNRELQRFRLISETMLNRKTEILDAMEKRAANPGRSIHLLSDYLRSIQTAVSRFKTALRRPLIWAPTAAALAIVNFLLFFGRNPDVAVRYQPLLTFNKLPYERITFRDWPNQKADLVFNQGMEFYDADVFDSAIVYMEQAVDMQPQMGLWWLYLGASYYMQRNSTMAITALQKADSLNSMIFSIRTRWYLAQSYLLKGDTTHAMPLLEWVARQNLSYTREASDLLNEVRRR